MFHDVFVFVLFSSRTYRAQCVLIRIDEWKKKSKISQVCMIRTEKRKKSSSLSAFLANNRRLNLNYFRQIMITKNGRNELDDDFLRFFNRNWTQNFEFGPGVLENLEFPLKIINYKVWILSCAFDWSCMHCMLELFMLQLQIGKCMWKYLSARPNVERSTDTFHQSLAARSTRINHIPHSHFTFKKSPPLCFQRHRREQISFFFFTFFHLADYRQLEKKCISYEIFNRIISHNFGDSMILIRLIFQVEIIENSSEIPHKTTWEISIETWFREAISRWET